MDTITTIEASELARHAERAAIYRREGGKLHRDNVTGAHYATSISTPGKWHAVTLLSCDCAGFVHHGHCKHNSAMILAHTLQELDPKENECPHCHGDGVIESKRSRWVGGGKTGYRSEWTIRAQCRNCDGTGKLVPVAA